MSKSFAAELDSEDIEEVSEYIESYWPKLIRKNKKDLRSLIGLPNPYIVPAPAEIFQEQYYWDSYPIVRALIDHPRYWQVAIGMVDNLLYLVERFSIVPNASRYYFLSRSQPPVLSSLVWLVYNKTKDLDWLIKAISLVELEYKNVWAGKVHLHNYRLIPIGLSRYYDRNALDVLAEAESGWDMTSRFSGKCLEYCPVDLNCLLYIYETDLVKAYSLLGDFKKVERFEKLSSKRIKLISKFMWNDKVGYYFDYNFVQKKKSSLITIAGTYPLSVGVASFDQAKRVVDLIVRDLEKDFGVVQSERFVENFQWDWPNGWAPIQLRVVEGLIRYGYTDIASRLIKKWLAVNIKVFKETGQLWEKYDVVKGRVGVPDRYPTQSGFGWTNATFLILTKILKSLEEVTPRQDLLRHPDASWLTKLALRY